MTQYDEEFEKFWSGTTYAKIGKANELAALKELAHVFWTASRVQQKQEVKKLKLKGGPWTIMGNGRVQADESSKDYCDAGREREDQGNAETAAEKMIKRDVLHAHSTEFMGREYVYVPGRANYFIAVSNRKYAVCHETEESLGTIYMTKQCAEYLCSALNDGRLEL